LLALSESYNIIAALTKYQLFLTSVIGLPKDDVGRTEITTASIIAAEKIRTEIRALEHELDRREGKEKSRF
jgi:predicted HAD superfamily phosphohydrolase